MTTYILFIIAIVLGLVLKKSRICTVYITSVMVFLAAYNYQNADIANYKIEYLTAQNIDSFRYIGYSSLIKLCSDVGMSWLFFRVMIYSVSFVLLAVTVRLLTKNVNFVLAIYLITFYGIDVVQIKTLVSNIMAFFAISVTVKFLSENTSLKNPLRNWRIIFSVIVLTLSIFIHFSVVFYLLAFFVFIMLYHRKNMTTKMVVMLLIMLAAIYGGAISVVARYANQLGILGDMNYLASWFQVSTRYGFLIPTAFAITAILSCNLTTYMEPLTEPMDSKEKINMLLSKFMITALMLVPLFVVNTTYDRLIRVYVLISLSYYANVHINVSLSKVRFVSMIFALITIAFSFYEGTYVFYDSTLGAILKYNSVI